MSSKKEKHPLVIGTCDGKSTKGYTIFKNADEGVVSQIKAMKINSDSFNYDFHKNSKIVNRLSDDELLCVDDEGKHFILDNEWYEDVLQNNLMNEINNKFNVAECLNKTFGELYTESGELIVFVRNPEVETYNGLGRVGFTQGGISISTWNGITVNEKTSGDFGQIMFAHLDTNGNIVNRDYNIDLVKMSKNRQITKKGIVEQIIEMIPDVKYKNYGNKWFSPKCNITYEPDFQNTYESDGEPILSVIMDTNARSIGKTKIPKTANDSNKNDILVKILPTLIKLKTGGPIDLSEYITISESKPVVPVRRKQKSKLKEEDFTDVYNLISESYIVDKPELMAALKNIENSINIPENEEIVKEYLQDYLEDGDLPSYSFDKGQSQEDHSDFIALVKLPHGCNFTFKIEEGDCVEATWSHTIYSTNVIELELVY